MSRELLQELLDWHNDKLATSTDFNFIMEKVEAELKNTDPKPFAWFFTWHGDEHLSCIEPKLQTMENKTPLYTHPPRQQELDAVIAERDAIKAEINLIYAVNRNLSMDSTEYIKLRKRVDGGIRVNAFNYGGIEAVQVFQANGNATLILDEGVEL